MKYLILVSHGKMAEGTADSLAMLAGPKEEVIAAGLENGKSADEFAELFESRLPELQEEDEIILLGDLIGGSPLSTALNVLSSKGLLGKTTILGGMNLPLALTTAVMKDAMDTETLVQTVLSEAHSGLRQFTVETAEEDDDI